MEWLWPLFAVPFYIAKAANKLLLSWWLEPWLQQRANQALWNDVQKEAYFLVEYGQRVKPRRVQVLPLDYASVEIDAQNISLEISRGQGEVFASVKPRFPQGRYYQLPLVIAALRNCDVTEPLSTLTDIAAALKASWERLNITYSDNNYADFESKLARLERSSVTRTKELEWEIRRSRNL